MGLFGKKRKKEELLPDLPESPGEIPRLPEPPPERVSIQPLNTAQTNLPLSVKSQNMPLNNLPALPALGHQSNQQEIKQAVLPKMQKSSFEALPHHSHLTNTTSTQQIMAEPANVIEESYEAGYPSTRTLEIPQAIKTTRDSTKSSEPIYIRLDKFQTTTQAFDEIKQKIIEIEKILAKIKEIKEKEEKELEEWEHEIQIIKSRIESIDNTLFKKL